MDFGVSSCPGFLYGWRKELQMSQYDAYATLVPSSRCFPGLDSRLPRSSRRSNKKTGPQEFEAAKMKGRCKHRQSHSDERPAPLPRCRLPKGRSLRGERALVQCASKTSLASLEQLFVTTVTNRYRRRQLSARQMKQPPIPCRQTGFGWPEP